MTIYTHGGDMAAYVVTVGDQNEAVFAPGSVVYVWQGRDGARITDLVDIDGQPITELVAGDGTVWPVGGLPIYRAPYPVVWLGAEGQPRVASVTLDVPDLIEQVRQIAEQAAESAAAAAASAAALAESSSVGGHEAAPDPHPGYLTPERGDERYLMRYPPPMAPQATPREVVTLTSVPAVTDGDQQQLRIIVGGLPELVSWRNERGYRRSRHVQGTLSDHLYVAVVRDTSVGRALMVDREDQSGQRTPIGGIDARGRVVTSDQRWVAIAAIDPDATGRYSASSTVGPAPLSVRWDADDVVRASGRIAATGVLPGDTLATVPAGYEPRALRCALLATSTGEVLPVEVQTTGRIVARAELDGPLEVVLDDVTWSRVEAPQPVGDWDIATAAWAEPGTTSPLTISHTSEAGHLYVLVLARSSAADPFDGVSDDGGNTWDMWAYAPTSGSVGRRIELWTCQPDSPFQAITIALSGSGTAYATLLDVTGHDPDDPIDDSEVAAVHRASSSSPTGPEVTPAVPGCAAIAAIACAPNTTAQITPPAGWQALQTHVGGPMIVYQVDPEVGTPLSASWQLASAAGSGHVLALIRPSQ